MHIGRWLFALLYGVSALGVATVLLSALNNIQRQLSTERVEVGEEHGLCGDYRGDGTCDPFEVDWSDKAAMQRGARAYMNYCLGCHSLGYTRYARIAEDLDIPTEVFEENLLFRPDQRMSDLAESAMTPQDAKNWFGAPPPDLTLVTRVRSPEWLYSYMRAFYTDASRPTGYNNLVLPGVAMPNIIEGLQGQQALVCEEHPYTTADGGQARHPITGVPLYKSDCSQLRVTDAGTMAPLEYEALVSDLVHFMEYVAEPYAQQRVTVGIYTVLYMLVFCIFAGLLYREYKKDYPNRQGARTGAHNK